LHCYQIYTKLIVYALYTYSIEKEKNKRDGEREGEKGFKLVAVENVDRSDLEDIGLMAEQRFSKRNTLPKREERERERDR
jgi:hypothetical protein